jgi:hypothetical protein
MKHGGFHILRVSMGVTFLWVGVLIFRDPEFWGSFLDPWAANLLAVPIREAMYGTAVLDIVIGVLFLIDAWVWVAGLLGTIHLAIVLAVSGIDVITVRDIGLLGAAAALFWSDLPEPIRQKFKRHGTHPAPKSKTLP